MINTKIRKVDLFPVALLTLHEDKKKIYLSISFLENFFNCVLFIQYKVDNKHLALVTLHNVKVFMMKNSRSK